MAGRPDSDGARDGLRAGVATVSLPADPGTPLMGYGARVGVADEVLDPLHVRALFVASGSDRAGGVLIVECELCLMAVEQALAVRRRIADRTGLAVERILVGCTHTHSAPDSGLALTLAGGDAPAWVPPILDAAVRAGEEAVRSAAAARLAVGRAVLSIGRNRRSAVAPADPTAWVARIDRAGGEPLAVLYLHGCHPTALGHDNLAISADWPGAASRAIEAALPGAVAIFAPAAHADVDPRTRGLLDLAIPDQSVGVRPEAMQALGREAGDAVAEIAVGLETRDDVAVGADSVRVEVPVHGAEDGPEARTARLARLRAGALEALGLPPDSEARTAELFALEAERVRDLPADETRRRLSRVRTYLRDRTAPRIAGGERPAVEVQVLRLGPLTLLGLPLECCVDVGVEWRERIGEPDAAVVSIANGWLRYLPHPRHFAEDRAAEQYEILQSTLTPDAATRLLDAGEALAVRLQPGRATAP